MNALRSCLLAGSILAAGAAGAEPITIVSEQDVARSWLHAPGVALVVAGYPKLADGPSRDVCVNIGYLINADGSTSKFTQMKAWSADSASGAKADLQPFVQSAAAAISTWKFVPAKGRPKLVYTSATFAFDGSKTQSASQIEANCRIPDLKAFVMEAQGKGKASIARQRESRREMERMANSGY